MLNIVMLCCMLSQLQKPEAPKPKVVDRQFVMVMSALALSKTADMAHTASILSPTCHESNPIFGPHPSDARLALENTAIFAGEVTLAYGLKKFARTHPKTRIFWMIEPMYQTALHTKLTTQNCHE